MAHVRVRMYARRHHKGNNSLHRDIVIESDFAIIALCPRIRIPSGRAGSCSFVVMRNHCCFFVRDKLPSRGCCSILHDAVALAVDGDDDVSSVQKHSPWVDSAYMTKARPSSVTGPSLCRCCFSRSDSRDWVDQCSIKNGKSSASQRGIQRSRMCQCPIQPSDIYILFPRILECRTIHSLISATIQ